MRIAVPQKILWKLSARSCRQSYKRRGVTEEICYTDCMSPVQIITAPIDRSVLQALARERFGDMVKAVVDIERNVMAIGGELHADEEQMLLEQGSKQEHVWGINLYPGTMTADWVEFDSMINLRPSQGNRSRGVENPDLQARIRSVVSSLIS